MRISPPILATAILLGLVVAPSIAQEVAQDALDVNRGNKESVPTSAEPWTHLNEHWESHVRPILSKNCLRCHHAFDRSGKLDLETIPGLVRGGLHGSAIDFEKPETSMILEVLQPQAKLHMPPEGQLQEGEREILSKWIERLARTPLPKEWKIAPSDSMQESNRNSDSSERISKLPLGVSPKLAIDLAVEMAWKSQNVVPASNVGDSKFARRVYLDLVGRVPRRSELITFLKSTESDKREKLVDALLVTEEHAVHMAEVFDAILIGRKDAQQLRRRIDVGWFDYLRTSIKNNRRWDRMVRDMILARPESSEERGAVWYLYSRQNKHQDIAEAISKDFFGIRIDCAQCHDHPLASEIEQKHYWGLVAFFNRSKNLDTPKGPRIAESAIGGFSEFTNLRGKSSPNQLVFFQRNPVDESRPEKEAKEEDREDLYHPSIDGEPKIPKFSRRAEFVDHILVDHPLLARGLVNRIWGWMLGRGIIHPIDSMDSFHPASHPELLDWLARDFASSGYDLRRLLRSLALTRVYQLDKKPEDHDDPKWLGSAIAKPLTAEQFYRSIQIVLELEDSKRWNSVEQLASFAQRFPDVLVEESVSNVSQGLYLSNGELLQQMVSVKESQWLKAVSLESEDRTIIHHLFDSILGREPDAEEFDRCFNYLSGRPNRQQAVEGLAWALIAGAEFRFTH